MLAEEDIGESWPKWRTHSDSVYLLIVAAVEQNARLSCCYGEKLFKFCFGEAVDDEVVAEEKVAAYLHRLFKWDVGEQRVYI